jgi:hypothetical protein
MEMTVLSVTSRGQVTFRREVLAHLGITPGDKLDSHRKTPVAPTGMSTSPSPIPAAQCP